MVSYIFPLDIPFLLILLPGLVISETSKPNDKFKKADVSDLTIKYSVNEIDNFCTKYPRQCIHLGQTDQSSQCNLTDVQADFPCLTVSWQKNLASSKNSSLIQFTMTGRVNNSTKDDQGNWFAFGFAENARYMQDGEAYKCTYFPNFSKHSVSLASYTLKGLRRLLPRPVSKNSIMSESVSGDKFSAIVQCVFQRPIDVKQSHYDLSHSYYLLMSIGYSNEPARGHVTSRTSVEKVNFNSTSEGSMETQDEYDTTNNGTQNVNDTFFYCSRAEVFKLFHACCMIISWGVFNKIAIFIAAIKRHDITTTCKKGKTSQLKWTTIDQFKAIVDRSRPDVAEKPNEEIDAEINQTVLSAYWLKMHVTFNTLTVIVSLLGVVCAFISAGWKMLLSDPHVTLSFRIHALTGFCVLSFSIGNAVLGKYRPHATAPSTNPYASYPIILDLEKVKAPRAKFVYFHHLFGYLLCVTGEVGIITGLYLYLDMNSHVMMLVFVVLFLVNYFLLVKAKSNVAAGAVSSKRSSVINKLWINWGFYLIVFGVGFMGLALVYSNSPIFGMEQFSQGRNWLLSDMHICPKI